MQSALITFVILSQAPCAFVKKLGSRRASVCTVIHNQLLDTPGHTPTKASSPCLSDKFPALFWNFKLIATFLLLFPSFEFLFTEKKNR